MLYELWSFSFKVPPGTDLEVPWVSYESELEQFVEKLLRQHLFCGDDSCVARKLTCDTVTGGVTEPAGDELGDVKWILPSDEVLMPPARWCLRSWQCARKESCILPIIAFVLSYQFRINSLIP